MQEPFNFFTVRSLKDLPVADASLQFRIESATGYVDFATFKDELCAHTWQCPGEGRLFLKALEEHAKKLKLTLTIPNVLNPALKHILESSGYSPTAIYDENFDQEIELWSKHG